MSDTNGWKGRRPRQPGGLGSEIAWRAEVMRRLAALETRASLRSASISSGGLTVKNGGGVVIRDGGQLQVLGTVGERIRFDDGRMYLRYGADDYEGHVAAGLATDGTTPALWLIPPRGNATGGDLDNAIVIAGRSGTNLGALFLGTLGRMQGTAGADIYLEAESGVTVRGGTGVTLDGEAGPVVLQSANQVSISAGPGQQMLLRAGGTMYLKANGTTTVAANTYISGSGADVTLYQVSSSRRYKVDIADHHTDQDALLSVRPTSWRDKAEVEADPTTTARYVGVIAEELHDLGLTEYVTYNPDGSAESVAYDRMVVGLLDVARTQRQQIAWLTEQVQALTGQTMPDYVPAPTPGVTALRPVPEPAPAPDPDPSPDPQEA